MNTTKMEDIQWSTKCLQATRDVPDAILHVRISPSPRNRAQSPERAADGQEASRHPEHAKGIKVRRNTPILIVVAPVLQLSRRTAAVPHCVDYFYTCMVALIRISSFMITGNNRPSQTGRPLQLGRRIYPYLEVPTTRTRLRVTA
ncbi:hypothetical protein AG1IA_10135 [Rhizoctonia solani AG-1 IA]|uniref:Uncharacterized protein n=1 Tax=Thanatephorus cucumeris (strain AG1-IA) TaxID=983506 RepID=L8WD10_THACA|nr:hypothetical protein AG1IA_10135 [Rhizoctonia solani AG-1 IA]